MTSQTRGQLNTSFKGFGVQTTEKAPSQRDHVRLVRTKAATAPATGGSARSDAAIVGRLGEVTLVLLAKNGTDASATCTFTVKGSKDSSTTYANATEIFKTTLSTVNSATGVEKIIPVVINDPYIYLDIDWTANDDGDASIYLAPDSYAVNSTVDK